MTISPIADQAFYHETIKRLIIAFGNLFDGIKVMVPDQTGEYTKIIDVPIGYSPKNKWLERIKAEPDFVNNVEITLPRIAFEIVDFRYDAERKIGTQGQYVVGTVDGRRTKLYNPVPWDFYINLYTITKTEEQALQILEQILPYFAPSMTVTIEVLPTFGIKKDVPFVLQQGIKEDTYEGSPETFRTVVQTLTFICKADLFGPIVLNSAIIKKVIADIYANMPDEIDPGSEPNEIYTATVNPFNANKEDTYVIDEEWVRNV